MSAGADAPLVECWFEFASTYSYPALSRVEGVAAGRGVRLAYRPFLLGPIFASQGWNTSPFNIYPAKGRYMWRDVERLCDGYGLPFRRPSAFPRSGLVAARVALLGAAEPWGPPFVRAVYRANFAEDRDTSSAGVVVELLRDLGLDGEALVARASTDENKEALRRQTERAQELGIFGSPSFVTRGELFWGDDRLEAAIRWAAGAG